MCINILVPMKITDNVKLFCKYGTAVKIFSIMDNKDKVLINLYRYHSRSEHSRRRRRSRILEKEIKESFDDAIIPSIKGDNILISVPDGVQMVFTPSGEIFSKDMYSIKNEVCYIKMKGLKKFLKERGSWKRK